MPKHIGGGLFVETVGEILGGVAIAAAVTLFSPEVLAHAPALPPPGIYFNMPDDVYHSLPAFSSSGVKKMKGSPMIFWGTTPWLNAEAEEERAEREEGKDHLPIGKAYHCRLLEGASAFAMRFTEAPDESLFEGCLVSTDDIKNAILRLEQAPITRVETGETVPDPKKPGEVKVLTRPAKKEDWIAQLLDLDPEARLLDREQEAYRKLHEGKTFLPPKVIKRIQIAAKMVECDPGISPYMKGGHAEVVLIWNCPVTGIPMKARVDYLRFTQMIDLKTVANQRERAFDEAIRWEIAGWKMPIQPSVYFEGAQEVRKLVRAHGASAIHVWGEDSGDVDQEEHEALVAWALKWASHVGADEWGWLFQQKGLAPITRLVWYPRRGTTKMITDDIVSIQKKRFRRWAETFGLEPWLDIKEPYTIADEEIPQSATD
jgi:hypothetical protein